MTVDKIIEEVARTYGGITPEDIRSQKRNANISKARQVSMYIVREITQMSMVEIGQTFGGRDHSTVVYAVRQVEKDLKKDPHTKAMVDDIIKNKPANFDVISGDDGITFPLITLGPSALSRSSETRSHVSSAVWYVWHCKGLWPMH